MEQDIEPAYVTYNVLAFGQATVAGMNPAFFPIFPSLMYDSYVTIGLQTSDGRLYVTVNQNTI